MIKWKPRLHPFKVVDFNSEMAEWLDTWTTKSKVCGSNPGLEEIYRGSICEMLALNAWKYNTDYYRDWLTVICDTIGQMQTAFMSKHHVPMHGFGEGRN